MKILSVLNARTARPRNTAKGYPAEAGDLWPAGVTAITFVVTQPDASSERFVAFAIDADGGGLGLYSIEVDAAALPGLMAAIERELVRGLGIEGSTGVFDVPPPPPPPREYRFSVAPAADHPVVAVAMIHHEVIRRLEVHVRTNSR